MIWFSYSLSLFPPASWVQDEKSEVKGKQHLHSYCTNERKLEADSCINAFFCLFEIFIKFNKNVEQATCVFSTIKCEASIIQVLFFSFFYFLYSLLQVPCKWFCIFYRCLIHYDTCSMHRRWIFFQMRALYVFVCGLYLGILYVYVSVEKGDSLNLDMSDDA